MTCEQFSPKPLILNNRDISIFTFLRVIVHRGFRSAGAPPFRRFCERVGAITLDLRPDLAWFPRFAPRLLAVTWVQCLPGYFSFPALPISLALLPPPRYTSSRGW